MECKKSNPLECCLFFTANSLARVMTKMGEEEFAGVGMTPSYAFLLTLAVDSPGISQKELAEALNMAPSTVSRFVDALAKRGLVRKEGQGRNTYIHPTEKGEALRPQISAAWTSLYERYSRIIGKDKGDKLTRLTAEASHKLLQG
jgi:DNA-binding MarR family transcriptional regulator